MSPITNEDLNESLKELKTTVNSLDREIRGHNGSDGIVTRLGKLELLVTERLAALTERNVLVDKQHEADSKDPSIVKWPYIFERLLAPVITAVLVYLVVHYFHP